MRAQRYVWLGLLLFGATLSACTGRGSSGFDISENATIGRVIDTQRCVDHQGLTICPADQSPSPVATASPTPTATVPTPAETTPTATATTAMSPTPTVAPTAPPRVHTDLSDQSTVTCVQATMGGPCRIAFGFSTHGFPAGTAFRVVARAIEPAGEWVLAPPPSLDATATDSYEANVLLEGPYAQRMQLAVLVFLQMPDALPSQFHELADTGAEYAFVTPDLVLEVDREVPATPTDTPVPEGGPQITYFGLARADDVALSPSAFDRDGRPIYIRATGQGIYLVVEARPGSTDAPVGLSAFDPSGGLPDLQILVARALGDGSPAVCRGGVPATELLRFTDSTAVADAVNDLGCHVNDGAGTPVGRSAPGLACTRSEAPGGFGYGFVDATTSVQYCLPVTGEWAFPPGDTIVAARTRGTDGRLGLTQQIVVRVGPAAPSPTASPPTPTATPTADGTPPATATTPPQPGPELTYLGITRADYVPVAPSGVDVDGRPIFDRVDGAGLVLVVEARPGDSGITVGEHAFVEQGVPDLQMLLSRPLGDGSLAVCDKMRPDVGGVPATTPLTFSDAPAVLDAMNDVGCRVSNGAGEPLAIRASGDACTRPDELSGDFAFVDATTITQFCLPVAAAWSFPFGETIVAVRVRDAAGEVGPVHEIVVRIGAPTPTATGSVGLHTPTPTPTPLASHTPTDTPVVVGDNPEVTYFGVARADDVPMPAAGIDEQGRPVYERATGQGIYLVIEARPGSSSAPVGSSAFDPAGGLPDLHVLVSRPLGDGSPAICDDTLPSIGGVPGTDPLAFSDAPAVVAAINDLGCRVNDGAGNPVARVAASQACTRTDAPGGFGYGFVDANSTIQYCLPIARPWGFPLGDTVVAARVRDSDGAVGAPHEIVIRVTGLP